MAARAIWKGAITFGLVLVPVAVYPASQEDDVDFDWLDKRSMDPVGYKRINKRTGKEIDKDNIVKGVKQADGDYVVLSDDEIREAYPKSTQTIEIETFVKASDVSFVYYEKPYVLEPAAKGEKVYALLREAMTRAGVVGIARVVMHNKEHLSVLVPTGPALMLNTLRWATEIRPIDGLNIPAAGKDGVAFKPAELQMAGELVKGMTAAWKPQDYDDKFADAIRTLVDRKAKAGKTEKVAPLEEAPSMGDGNVVDLTELLRNSLGKRKPAASAPAPAPTPAAKKSAARKTPVATKAKAARKRA